VVNPSSGTEQSSVMLYEFLQMIYQLLPHLDAATVSLMLIYGDEIPMSDVLLFCLEHLSYAGVCFCFAIWIFQRRDL